MTRARAPAASSRLVYSTDPSRRACAKCGAYPCDCAGEPPPVPPGDQRLVVCLDRSGRKGKTVTRVANFAGPSDERTAVLRDLQKACACGGTVEGDALELAGDHRERAIGWLEARGYRVARRG